MKKVLSFVLVLSMILGSFGMAFAAPADVVGTDYEDAVNALTELGVIAGYKDGSFKPEKVVTRAEAATFVIKAMGLEDYAVGKSTFADMAGHWADPYVAYAASLGFVKGNTDGTFAPDATVTYDQAITMLVQALGYKAEYMVGGYPGAFVNQAKTLGMLKGVVSGAVGANRGDVATLLFNTLTCDFVRYDNDGRLQTTVLEGEVAD
ncbi:MAG: S-layer homology domain-containing protein, partial [Firmicutes bacterium]|nr:S-layer homology domain-containing protein [Bacillota bacterium]